MTTRTGNCHLECATTAAGRWPGSRDGGWPEKIVARLPADLVAQVHAACWHTSKHAIEALRRWRDTHPAVVLAREDLTVYEDLAAQVTTTGRVWRAAVDRALPVADHPACPRPSLAFDSCRSRHHRLAARALPAPGER
jgi:hypothetical protein